MLFNFAVLVPGACRRARAAAAEAGRRLHRQRPAPELEQHDHRRRRQHRHRRQRRQHGDDQHRLGRRVQGPDQRVSGRVRPRRRRTDPGGDQERLAAIPRLGLLVRPPLGLERQHLDEQPQDAENAAAEDQSRTTAATPSAVRCSSPACSTPNKQKLFFFFSQEFQSRNDPPSERQTRVPTALERQGDFSQSVDSNGNQFPYIRDYTTGLPCSAADTRGCFQDGGVLGRIPASRLYQPGLDALDIFPQPNFSRRQRHQLHQPGADQEPAPRRPAAPRLPGDAQLAGHRPLHEHQERQPQPYGTTWAGNGSDHLDRSTRCSCTPGPTTCSRRPAS